jgi:hypothetical protein
MKVQSVKPVWGDNYNFGYIGFTYATTSKVAAGIAYFTRWSRREIPVSHALVVTGENSCIEAYYGVAIRERPLTDYFDHPKRRIFFRKPVDWTPSLGMRISDCACSKIGHRYATGLIVAQAAANTWLGRLINEWTGGGPDRWVSNRLSREGSMICSQLAAWCLGQQPELHGRGILARPHNTIDPQELFEDDQVFEPWSTKLWVS